MDKTRALLGSAVFFLIAPGTVVGLIPWLITGWTRADGAASISAYIGMLLIALGVAGLVESYVRFALEGGGTPAPVAPTKRLVVKGLFRWVRNPIYLSVLIAIIGQALYFMSIGLVWYAAAVWIAVHLFVVFFEERRLRREFGDQYGAFCKNVPRWIPRLTPWRQETGAATERQR